MAWGNSNSQDLSDVEHEVEEVERHLHSKGVCFGKHTSVVAGVNEGEAWSIVPFESTSGTNQDFGAWIPVLGTGDTPFRAGNVKFDPHRMSIADVDSDASKKVHTIQLCWGLVDAATAYAAGEYSGVMPTPEKDGKADPVEIQIEDIAAGTKLWLRHRVIGDNGASSMEFYIEAHEYPPKG